MKRLIPICMLTLLLAGCGASAPAEPVPPPPDIQDPVPPPVEEPVVYQLDTLVYEDTVLSEDGVLLANVHFELPQLQALQGGAVLESGETPLASEALQKVENFNTQFDSWTNGDMVRELKTWVLEDYAVRPEFFTEMGGTYSEELTHSAYQTEDLISIAGFYYTFTGGAHPNSWMMSWNYDMTTGEFLRVLALSGDEEGFRQAVAEEILRQAAQPREDGTIPLDTYFEDHEKYIADWSSYATFFDEDGMTVIFSPYELASYAEGSQIFTISYDFLRPWLTDHGMELLGLQ